MGEPIYHLALEADWSDPSESYRGSTIGRSVDEVGFVHASTATQVSRVADLWYRGREDVVLLEIDPDRLDVPLRYEAADDGERFPHIYGPLPKAAVLRATPLRRGGDGALQLGHLG